MHYLTDIGCVYWVIRSGKLPYKLVISVSVCKSQYLLCNEQAAADVTEAVHCHVGDWSTAAVTSLKRRRIDKIAVISLDIILLDHTHFSSSVTQVSVAHFLALVFLSICYIFLYECLGC